MSKILATVLLATLISTASARADQNSPQLGDLFKQLQSVTDPGAVAETERRIWRLWSLPDDRTASVPFAQGVIAMNEGKLRQARALFTNVTETAPDFAEGWNKRATVAYFLGDFETSVHDIQKTLTLEPRHFGALSGLALIYEATGLESQALDVLIQVKEIHPSMPGIDVRMQALRDAIAAKKT
jgi:tetratricopeptide (TPR) repeat protein